MSENREFLPDSAEISAPRVRIHLFGELVRFSGGRGYEFEWPLAAGRKARELLAEIGIPEDEVWMIAINGTRVSTEAVPRPGDEMMVFSPVGGG